MSADSNDTDAPTGRSRALLRRRPENETTDEETEIDHEETDTRHEETDTRHEETDREDPDARRLDAANGRNGRCGKRADLTVEQVDRAVERVDVAVEFGRDPSIAVSTAADVPSLRADRPTSEAPIGDASGRPRRDGRTRTARERILEARVAVLEGRLDRRRNDLQAVIDRYEALLTEQRRAVREELDDARRDARTTESGWTGRKRTDRARTLVAAVKRLVSRRR